MLGQEWLWMRKAKISFGFSSKTCEHDAKIVIDGMSIPLIEENKTSKKNRVKYSIDSDTSSNSDTLDSNSGNPVQE